MLALLAAEEINAHSVHDAMNAHLRLARQYSSLRDEIKAHYISDRIKGSLRSRRNEMLVSARQAMNAYSVRKTI
jgi:hypothetical protein